MKTYKFKSIVYFACFLMASILYYGIEQKQAFDEQMRLLEMAEIEVQTIDDDTKDLEVDEQP